MNRIKRIVIHTSDSKFGGVSDVRKWHVEENGWRDIGYHFLILNGNFGQGLFIDAADGSIADGRGLDGDEFLNSKEQGAHAYGFNSDSIAICMIGKNGEYTDAQWLSLKQLLYQLMVNFSIQKENVMGHNEVSNKTCPDFDVQAFMKTM